MKTKETYRKMYNMKSKETYQEMYERVKKELKWVMHTCQYRIDHNIAPMGTRKPRDPLYGSVEDDLKTLIEWES